MYAKIKKTLNICALGYKHTLFNQRYLNTPPTFSSSLKSITVTKWKVVSYLLPSVIDLEKDDYTVTATLASNENPLPSWIQFDSRRFVISPPKGTPRGMISHWISFIGNDFNIKIRVKDSGGLYSDYILNILIIDSPLILRISKIFH